MERKSKKYFYSDLDRLTKEELRQVIEAEEAKFDLNAFFHKKGESTGGVLLITPDSLIMTDTFLRDEIDPSYGNHRNSFEALYKYLYGHKMNVKTIWPRTFLDEGSIVIQLCCDYPTIMWIPKDITPFQFVQLAKLNETIKGFYLSDKDYFDKFPMQFDASYGDVVFDVFSNNFDILIDAMKSNLIYGDSPSELEKANSLR